jgi:hypothetical protein
MPTMIFASHDPALHIFINVPLPHHPHIDEIDLYTIVELRRQDGLLCFFVGGTFGCFS